MDSQQTTTTTSDGRRIGMENDEDEEQAGRPAMGSALILEKGMDEVSLIGSGSLPCRNRLAQR